MRLPLIFIFTLIVSINYAGCFTTNDGNSNGDVSVSNCAIGALNGFQYEATIYTNADLGSFGLISTVGVYVETAGSASIPLKIYMRNNADADQTAMSWIAKTSTATLVFDGVVSLSNAGWNVITLDSPFDYNVGNFEIMFESSFGGSGAGFGNYPSNRFYNPPGKNPKLHQHWESDFIAPGGNGAVSDLKPIIRLGFQENVTWNGTSSNDWNTAANWSSGNVPCNCDIVTLVSGTPNDPVIGADDVAECGDLTINSGVVLEIGNTNAGGGSFSIYGDLLNNGSIYHTSDLNTSLEGESNTFGGTGIFTHLNEFCSFNVTEKANYTLSSDINALHQLRMNGTFNLSTFSCPLYTFSFDAGTMNLNSGTLQVANSIDYTSGTINVNTGTVYFNSGDPIWSAIGLQATNQTINSFNYYNLKIRTNNGLTATIGDGSSITVANDLTIENPDQEGGSANVLYETSVSGDFYLANTGNALTLNLSERIYRSSGTGTFFMGNLANNAINVYYSSAVNDAISGFGSMTFSGSVSYQSSDDQRIMPSVYGLLTFSNGGNKILNNDIVINGDLKMLGGDFQTQGFNVNIGGDWINTGATFTPSTSRIIFDGSSQQSISRSGGAALTIISENFSAGFPSGWNSTNDGGHTTEDVQWRPSASQCGFLTLGSTTGSTGFLVVDADCDGGTGMAVGSSTIETGTYNFSNYTNVTLGFQHYYDDLSADDQAQIDYRIGAGPWVNVDTWTTDQGSAANPSVFSQAIPALDGQSSVQFRFVYTSGWDWDWSIDDFVVTGDFPASTEVFDNISVDGAGVLINSPIQINTEFTFTNGIVSASSANYIEFDEDAVASNTSDASHVAGPVRKLSNSINKFVFPTGDGANYRASAVTPSNNDPTTWSSEFFPTQHPNYTSLTGAGIDHISPAYYWDISRLSGTANGKVGLYWNSGSGVNVPSDLIVAHYNGTAWEKIGTNPIINGTASSGDIEADVPSTSFSPFNLGSGTGNNPLPVGLLSFTGTCNNSDVEIGFSVQSQVNNDYFIIERSPDAIAWEEIAQIEGAGNTNAQMDYTFSDINSISGISYYRLKQVDYDGDSEIFYPISVSCEQGKVVPVEVYPNPTNSEFTFEIELDDFQGTDVYYNIMDARGSIVKRDRINLNRGFNKAQLNIAELPNGLYLLKFENTKVRIPEQRIIKR